MNRQANNAQVSLLLSSGVSELAAGALSGWVYTLARTQPELARRLGIRSAGRIRQWHLDMAMLGTATAACALAVPEPPPLAAAALGVGAWTNAMAFLPLAFNPELESQPVFRGLAIASFVVTSTGFSGMALALRKRRREQQR